MLTGVFRGDIGGTEPSSIELYALEDIPDLVFMVSRLLEMVIRPLVRTIPLRQYPLILVITIQYHLMPYIRSHGLARSQIKKIS